MNSARHMVSRRNAEISAIGSAEFRDRKRKRPEENRDIPCMDKEDVLN